MVTLLCASSWLYVRVHPRGGPGAGAGWGQEIDLERNSQRRWLESARSALSIKSRRK